MRCARYEALAGGRGRRRRQRLPRLRVRRTRRPPNPILHVRQPPRGGGCRLITSLSGRPSDGSRLGMRRLPYRTYCEGKQVQKRFFTMKFPVAVDAKAATFTYVDPGLTTEPHSRAAHEPTARRAGSRGFTAGFQAADLVTAGFNLRTRAALHTRARATESSSHRGRCFGRRRRSDTD